MENISIPQEKLYIPVGVKISSWLFLFAGIFFAWMSYLVFIDSLKFFFKVSSPDFLGLLSFVFLAAVSIISFLIIFFLRKMMKRVFKVLPWFLVLVFLNFGNLFSLGWGFFLSVGFFFFIFGLIAGGYLSGIKKHFVN